MIKTPRTRKITDDVRNARAVDTVIMPACGPGVVTAWMTAPIRSATRAILRPVLAPTRCRNACRRYATVDRHNRRLPSFVISGVQRNDTRYAPTPPLNRRTSRSRAALRTDNFRYGKN
jgi:hypothetical protein